MTRIAPLVLACCLASVTATAGPSGDGSIDGPEDPNATRLLIGPTARSLGRGQVYIDSFGISLPFVQVGITDRISMGAGAPLLFPGITPGQIYWLTPKVQIVNGPRTQASVGILHLKVDGEASGIAYGVMTRGSTDSALTLGLGYTYRAGEDAKAGAPLVLIGGEKRLSRTVKVITENYLAPTGGLVNGGLRVIRRHASVDLGLGAVVADTGMFLVPIIRIAYTF